jgi:hypothetical protein
MQAERTASISSNFIRSGLTWASPEIVVSPAREAAALPAITVKDDGTVVIMYETYASDNRACIHVASSEDFGACIASDIVDYAFTPLALLQATAAPRAIESSVTTSS